MSRREEIDSSWNEFNGDDEERYLGEIGLEQMYDCRPYTQFEKDIHDREKEDYLNGKDFMMNESTLFSLIKESVRNILKEEFNIDDYKESSDGWVKSLANLEPDKRGYRMGMSPEEIQYLIQRREKEQNDYEIEQYNKSNQIDDLKSIGDSALDKRINGVSYGSNGSIYDDSLWDGHEN